MNAQAQTFEIAGGFWRICDILDTVWPPLGDPAATSSGRPEADTHALTPHDLYLSFTVSSDEEHVELRVTAAGRTVDLGARAHNYLLLTLARRRISDAEQGLPEPRCGWLCQDDLAHDPMMNKPRLNVDVFRIRRQFAAYGIGGAHGIIERRARARQLRIGVSRLSVTRL